MPLYRQVFLLFTLNFVDAVLTIFWVRNGYATEGNHLMSTLLDIGDMPFLMVKLAVGGGFSQKILQTVSISGGNPAIAVIIAAIAPKIPIK